jgi:carbonic anhydrase/acetyltransferase-like protein (isoleucine patch superfamily)
VQVLIEHDGKRPDVDESAYVAPTAVVCGDVTIGPDSRVLFGAVLTAEGGPVELARASATGARSGSARWCT